MRLGLIGPAHDNAQALERAIEMLMADPDVRQVIYLGDDGGADQVVESWSQRYIDDEQFLDRGARLACAGSAGEIDGLLADQSAAARLWAIRRLPDPPARAIEMMDKWLVLAVHDKAVLDEDDISNAHIIVYGKSDKAGIKRFGPRSFFTPGPVDQGKVGLLELMPHGQLELRILSLEGKVLVSETARATSARVVVTE
ncbi:MAG: hypothetical protein OXT09_17670 [Myxococcales bacterium]|nr:hypothetical protein [Myxococcales bacterium]